MMSGDARLTYKQSILEKNRRPPSQVPRLVWSGWCSSVNRLKVLSNNREIGKPRGWERGNCKSNKSSPVAGKLQPPSKNMQ